MALSVESSSHLTPLNPRKVFDQSSNLPYALAKQRREEAAERLQNWLPGVPEGEITSFGGLTLADVVFDKEGGGTVSRDSKEYKKRRSQVDKLKGRMNRSNLKTSLLVAGSNDFKFFIVKEGSLHSIPPTLNLRVNYRFWVESGFFSRVI